MLERYAVKVARTVLRGGSGSNATSLPDQLTLARVLNGLALWLRFIHWVIAPAQLNQALGCYFTVSVAGGIQKKTDITKLSFVQVEDEKVISTNKRIAS